MRARSRPISSYNCAISAACAVIVARSSRTLSWRGWCLVPPGRGFGVGLGEGSVVAKLAGYPLGRGEVVVVLLGQRHALLRCLEMPLDRRRAVPLVALPVLQGVAPLGDLVLVLGHPDRPRPHVGPDPSKVRPGFEKLLQQGLEPDRIVPPACLAGVRAQLGLLLQFAKGVADHEPVGKALAQPRHRFLGPVQQRDLLALEPDVGRDVLCARHLVGRFILGHHGQAPVARGG
jgi:hypothetical protein